MKIKIHFTQHQHVWSLYLQPQYYCDLMAWPFRAAHFTISLLNIITNVMLSCDWLLVQTCFNQADGAGPAAGRTLSILQRIYPHFEP